MNYLLAYSQAVVARCRPPVAQRAPAWVTTCTGRLGQILIERHLCRAPEAWGLAKCFPNQELPYDEVGSCWFHHFAPVYGLYEQVGGWDDEAKQRTIRFWQSWQNPSTGRFVDPRDPGRSVNEKYIANLLGQLGASPLYPWTTTSTTGAIDPTNFLARTRKDPDWADGGWGVGSHTGFMAVELMQAIARGQEDLVPALEQGLTQILSHQDAGSGLWGPPTATLDNRIGGTLKVIGRLYFRLGLVVPHSRALADSCIERQRAGEFRACSTDACIPRNAIEMVAYCLEVDDYRRADLWATLASLAEITHEHLNPDGSVSWRRGNLAEAGGLASLLEYPLGICGAYLHWTDCPFTNPLDGLERGLAFPYRPVMLPDGRVGLVRQATPGPAEAEPRP